MANFLNFSIPDNQADMFALLDSKHPELMNWVAIFADRKSRISDDGEYTPRGVLVTITRESDGKTPKREEVKNHKYVRIHLDTSASMPSACGGIYEQIFLRIE